MKAAFLDWDSLKGNELDTASLDALPVDWQFYANISSAELRTQISQVEVVVSNKVLLDENLLANASELKLICIAATGTNNVDLQAAQQRNIPVCNVRGYATDSVVQHVFMLLLNLSRQFVAYQQDLQAGCWQQSEYFCLLTHPIQSLTGKTLGIIGYGELGQAVAKMAKTFGMRVIVAQSLKNTQQNSIADPDRFPLIDVLRESDVLSLHCPLTKQTKNLISDKELSEMKSTALLINTARGGIVDETALLEALQSGQIAGAALDVLAQEPPMQNHPLLVASINRSIPNLIITPHIAWASRESRQNLVNKIAHNIRSWLDGQIINQVTANKV